MCGIAGFASTTGARADATKLATMIATLRHRGPDDTGLFVEGPAAIGAARLSIIDVAGGHQPMSLVARSPWRRMARSTTTSSFAIV